jgi:hypothetical protein
MGFQKFKLVTYCALVCALTAPGNGQTSLAEVNDRTPPERVAQLAWQAIFTFGCRAAPDSLFLTFEVNADRDDGMRRLGKDVRWKINEYRATTHAVQASDISKADSLNGVQWHGIATFKIDAYRQIENYPGNTSNPWSAWQDGYDNPVIELRKVNGKWSVTVVTFGTRTVFLNGSLPGTYVPLLVDGIPANPEFLDYKISCEEATSAQPLAKYTQNYSRPEPGQWFCPGTVLGSYTNHRDLVVTSPTQIQSIESNFHGGGTGIYIGPRKGDMDMGYGIRRGHAQASCAPAKGR